MAYIEDQHTEYSGKSDSTRGSDSVDLGDSADTILTDRLLSGLRATEAQKLGFGILKNWADLGMLVHSSLDSTIKATDAAEAKVRCVPGQTIQFESPGLKNKQNAEIDTASNLLGSAIGTAVGAGFAMAGPVGAAGAAAGVIAAIAVSEGMKAVLRSRAGPVATRTVVCAERPTLQRIGVPSSRNRNGEIRIRTY